MSLCGTVARDRACDSIACHARSTLLILLTPHPSFHVILEKVIPNVAAHRSGTGASAWRGVDILIESDALLVVIKKYLTHPAHDVLNPSIAMVLKSALSFCGATAADALVQNLSDTTVAIKSLQDEAREAVSPFVCHAFVDVVRSLKRADAGRAAAMASAAATKTKTAKAAAAGGANGGSSAYVKDGHANKSLQRRLALQQKRVESLKTRSDPLFAALQGGNRSTILSSYKSMVQMFQSRDALNCLTGLRLASLNKQLKKAGKPVVGDGQAAAVVAAAAAAAATEASESPSSSSSATAEKTSALAKQIAEQALTRISKSLAKPGDAQLDGLLDDVRAGKVGAEVALQQVSMTMADSKKKLSALEKDSSTASSAVRKRLEASTSECDGLESEIKALEAKLGGLRSKLEVSKAANAALEEELNGIEGTPELSKLRSTVSAAGKVKGELGASLTAAAAFEKALAELFECQADPKGFNGKCVLRFGAAVAGGDKEAAAAAAAAAAAKMAASSSSALESEVLRSARRGFCAGSVEYFRKETACIGIMVQRLKDGDAKSASLRDEARNVSWSNAYEERKERKK